MIYYINDKKLDSKIYRHPYFVYALDIEAGVGFTPQDSNYWWRPNENFLLTDEKTFKELVRGHMKVCTTHFDTKRFYYNESDTTLEYKINVIREFFKKMDASNGGCSTL